MKPKVKPKSPKENPREKKKKKKKEKNGENPGETKRKLKGNQWETKRKLRETEGKSREASPLSYSDTDLADSEPLKLADEWTSRTRNTDLFFASDPLFRKKLTDSIPLDLASKRGG